MSEYITYAFMMLFVWEAMWNLEGPPLNQDQMAPSLLQWCAKKYREEDDA